MHDGYVYFEHTTNSFAEVLELVRVENWSVQVNVKPILGQWAITTSQVLHHDRDVKIAAKPALQQRPGVSARGAGVLTQKICTHHR